MGESINGKVIVLLTLAVLAAVLFLLWDVNGGGAPTSTVSEGTEDLQPILDSLFHRYGIEHRQVKTWRVRGPGGELTRVQDRITVPNEFVSVSFNHDLNLELTHIGARAVATERTKENTVTMHIKMDRRIVRSISFVLSPRTKENQSSTKPG